MAHVLIIHDSQFAVELIRLRLQDAGFVEGQDFVIDRDPEVVEKSLLEGKKQLLITSEILVPPGTMEVVHRFKRINPQLTTTCLGDDEIEGDFDVWIPQSSGSSYCAAVVGYVTVFMHGIS